MYHGLDSARCPTPSDILDIDKLASTMSELGNISWIGVYLGAPFETPSPVTKAQFDAIRSAFPNLRFKFLYVPHPPPYSSGDGFSYAADATAAAIALGVTPDTIYLDIEASWWDNIGNTLMLIGEFTNGLRNRKLTGGLYSSPSGILHSASLTPTMRPDMVWFADWTDTEPSNLEVPGFPAQMFDVNQRTWQWKNSVTIGNGGTYDLNVSDDPGNAFTVSEPTPNPTSKPVEVKPVTTTPEPATSSPFYIKTVENVTPTQNLTVATDAPNCRGVIISTHGVIVFSGLLNKDVSVGSSDSTDYAMVFSAPFTFEVTDI